MNRICNNCGAEAGLHHYETHGKSENIYKENYELKNEIKQMKENFSSISSMIVCIGGPLNDNVHRYNKKQLVIFSQILAIARQWEEKE